MKNAIDEKGENYLVAFINHYTFSPIKVARDKPLSATSLLTSTVRTHAITHGPATSKGHQVFQGRQCVGPYVHTEALPQDPLLLYVHGQT